MHVFARRLAAKALTHGDVTIIDADGVRHRFGDGTGDPFVLNVSDRRTERRIALDPTLKFAEAYMDGTLRFEEGDLYGFLDLLYENVSRLPEIGGWVWIEEVLRFATRRLHQWNGLRRSSANVQHHYDISNDLYTTFLDEDMQYSCAYFADPDMSLEEAQRAKKRHIAAKLLIEPGQKVLDIGCGWGGMALYLARLTGAHVTGVTLSDEQFRLAEERRQEAGLSTVRFLKRDYRLLDEPVDRIVSVGMFEHVGVNNYDTYFEKCAALLEEDGVMLLHSIGRSNQPGVTNAFIRKYIFPGGYIPSLSEVLPAIERSGLIATDIEILRLHYAETLREWRRRFFARVDELGPEYDDRFRRMWEFYLVSSELAFRRLRMMVFQIQLARRQEAVPLTRDYLTAAEAALAEKEARRDLNGFATPFATESSGDPLQP